MPGEPTTIDLAHTAGFSLGQVTVEPSLRQLRMNGGAAEQLEPRVMQVLVALARTDGQVVTRSDLEASCWSGRVVSDDAINRTISQVRRLAERSGEHGFTLTTLPRVGYKLEAAATISNVPFEPVIAVLPFDDISSDPTMRWLSDGVAEEILQTIARGTTIRVIGRSSSFQFRNASKSITAIGNELGATHVLDGLIQRQKGKTRVSAQLVETASQIVLWSDRFDLDTVDEFKIQDKIAECVALALDRTFAAASRPSDIDPVGYELYLRGAELTRDISKESQRRAVALLEASTSLIPDLADAWGNLALARTQGGFFEPEVGDWRDNAAANAARALSLDPECRTARLIPYVGGSLFDFRDHRRTFERPQPSSFGRTASPDVSFGVQMLELGCIEEAVEFFDQAERFDPFFQIQVFYQSHALLAHRDIADGTRKLDEAIARWPSIPFFLASRLRWAAAVQDWETIDTLAAAAGPGEHALQHRAPDVSAWIAFCRTPDVSPDALRRLRESAFAIGQSGLEELLLYAREAGLAHAFSILSAAGQPVVRMDAPRRPDDLGTIALWLPAFDKVRADPDFNLLLEKLGLDPSNGHHVDRGNDCQPPLPDVR